MGIKINFCKADDKQSGEQFLDPFAFLHTQSNLRDPVIKKEKNTDVKTEHRRFKVMVKEIAKQLSLSKADKKIIMKTANMLWDAALILSELKQDFSSVEKKEFLEHIGTGIALQLLEMAEKLTAKGEGTPEQSELH